MEVSNGIPSLAGVRLLQVRQAFQRDLTIAPPSTPKARPGAPSGVEALLSRNPPSYAEVVEAEPASVRLEFKQNTIDLKGWPGLRIEVSGAEGVRQFSFGSGQNLDNVAAAFNVFMNETGVEAMVSPTASGVGLVFSSMGEDPGEFVSVRLLDSGVGAGPGGGPIRLSALDGGEFRPYRPSYAGTSPSDFVFDRGRMPQPRVDTSA